MIWTILNSYLSGMPQDFESLSAKDAEKIMQAWADAQRTSAGRPDIGKLEFNWVNANGTNVCWAFYHRNGKQLEFMKIAGGTK